MPPVCGYGAPCIIVVCEWVTLHPEFDLKEFNVREHCDTKVSLIAEVLHGMVEAANEDFNREVIKAIATKGDRKGVEGLLDCFPDAK